jgi:hypothetical protein
LPAIERKSRILNLLWSASFTPDKAVELEGRTATKVIQLQVERACRMRVASMSIKQELRDTTEKFSPPADQSN